MRGKFVFLMLMFIFIGAGCSRDINTGEASGFLSNITTQARDAFMGFVPGFISEAGSNFVRNLNDVEKGAIDTWLKENNLNQFGDSLDTLYTGGSPLFNEVTGESIDRFKYLFEKFPGLKDIVEQQIKEGKDASALK